MGFFKHGPHRLASTVYLLRSPLNVTGPDVPVVVPNQPVRIAMPESYTVPPQTHTHTHTHTTAQCHLHLARTPQRLAAPQEAHGMQGANVGWRSELDAHGSMLFSPGISTLALPRAAQCHDS